MFIQDSHIFHRDGALVVEDCSVEDLAAAYGTPLYVYSEAALVANYRRLRAAFAPASAKICYAVKANSNLALLQLLCREGSGFDVVSGGELKKVIVAGASPEKVVFSGVGKTDAEIQQALEAGVGYINVESIPEFDRVELLASRFGTQANILLRVNPHVDAKTHHYITTGLEENKFGIALDDICPLASRAVQSKALNFRGLHCHIGSQVKDASPYLEAISRLGGLIADLANASISVETLNIGGGFGVPYSAGEVEKVTPLESIATEILNALGRMKCNVLVEPGRYIVANSGILVTKVLYVKEGKERHFVIVDAGMNDLLRPSLYNAYHEIQPVRLKPPNAGKSGPPIKQAYDVVGPICESADCFGRAREMQPVQPGNLLAIMSAGAYGFVLSSNYNSRPRVSEILVRGKASQIVRERESTEDMWRLEKGL